jgi:hypothetical protein
MSSFAKINSNNIVVDVIRADQEFIDSGVVGDPALWIQTSYNTRGNIHYGPDGNPDGGVALRANYAVIGGTYNREYDIFHAPKPEAYPSFIIGSPTWMWTFPIPRPNDGLQYTWDEETRSWLMRVME